MPSKENNDIGYVFVRVSSLRGAGLCVYIQTLVVCAWWIGENVQEHTRLENNNGESGTSHRCRCRRKSVCERHQGCRNRLSAAVASASAAVTATDAIRSIQTSYSRRRTRKVSCEVNRRHVEVSGPTCTGWIVFLVRPTATVRRGVRLFAVLSFKDASSLSVWQFRV